MRILITGSSGQIGTNLALRCLAEGHAVLGIDRRANPWTSRIETVRADLAAPQATELSTLERPDLVVHLAAHAKVHELVHRPELALENMVATHRALELCRGWNAPVIFSSSREVYGDIHRFDTQETSADFAFTESTYSASKIAGEAMVYAYARCYGLPYIVFRFSNVYGRYDNDLERMERVIPLFIDRIGRDLPITIHGEDKILDFTHVDDCVDGIVRGVGRLAAREVVNQTINLAHGTGHSLLEMAERVGAALGRRPRVTLGPSQVGEVTRYVANLDRARTLLGYAPRIPLADGIPLAVAWGREWAGQT